jgi:hypothetical protein
LWAWLLQDFTTTGTVVNCTQRPALTIINQMIIDASSLAPDVYTLRTCPASGNSIVSLSRQQGLSNASIARELTIFIKTVEAQMTLAINFIRRYFTAKGIVLSVLISLLWR